MLKSWNIEMEIRWYVKVMEYRDGRSAGMLKSGNIEMEDPLVC